MMQMTEREKLKNPFEGWTTVEDAARVTGRNRVTIRNWARKGYIACYTIGPKIEVVNIEEVLACSEEHPPYNTKKTFDKTEQAG